MEGYLDTEDAKMNLDQGGNGIPVFLKVLCILTFVGAGIGILSSLYTIFGNEFAIRTLERSQNNPFGGFIDYSDYIEKLRKWGVIAGVLNLLASGFCLLGALMMWKLKKTGYFIYIAGQIIPFIVLYGLLGGGPTVGALQGFQVVIQGFSVLFPIAFIIMYGLNLKHLK